eukprot:7750560-Alexandrium_andersonii.AAC.1
MRAPTSSGGATMVEVARIPGDALPACASAGPPTCHDGGRATNEGGLAPAAFLAMCCRPG